MGQTDQQKIESTLLKTPSGNWIVKAFAVVIIGITRTSLQSLITGSAVQNNVIYSINDAVGSTAVIQVDGLGTNQISISAKNATTGQFGTYDITTDIFTPNT